MSESNLNAEAIQVIIEIPAFAEPVKYEFDKKERMLVVDRFLGTAMQYPANYGFVPDTLSEDGDPIDVLVVTPIPLKHGCMIKCRPIGMLKMTDESGVDTKVLAVPVDKLTKQYQHVKEPQDLPAALLAQIKHFFEHYKDLEPGKWVKVEGFESSARAIEEITASIKRAGH
jgi:inorganic pyrophosphatase